MDLPYPVLEHGDLVVDAASRSSNSALKAVIDRSRLAVIRCSNTAMSSSCPSTTRRSRTVREQVDRRHEVGCRQDQRRDAAGRPADAPSSPCRLARNSSLWASPSTLRDVRIADRRHCTITFVPIATRLKRSMTSVLVSRKHPGCSVEADAAGIVGAMNAIERVVSAPETGRARVRRADCRGRPAPIPAAPAGGRAFPSADAIPAIPVLAPTLTVPVQPNPSRPTLIW